MAKLREFVTNDMEAKLISCLGKFFLETGNLFIFLLYQKGQNKTQQLCCVKDIDSKIKYLLAPYLHSIFRKAGHRVTFAAHYRRWIKPVPVNGRSAVFNRCKRLCISCV